MTPWPLLVLYLGLGVAALSMVGSLRRDRMHVGEFVGPAPPRLYVPSRGWSGGAQWAARGRSRGELAVAALLAALGGVLLGADGAAVTHATAVLVALLGPAMLVRCLRREARSHRGRHTHLCIKLHALIALAVAALVAAQWLAPGCPASACTNRVVDFAAAAARVVTTQMYLVSVIRKLRSRGFRSGRVVFDLGLFAWAQSAAGNRDFLGPVGRFVVGREGIRRARTLSLAALVAEAALGFGVLVGLPPWLVIGLGLLTHGAFAVLAPLRILPFSVSAVTLLAVGTAGRP